MLFDSTILTLSSCSCSSCRRTRKTSRECSLAATTCTAIARCCCRASSSRTPTTWTRATRASNTSQSIGIRCWWPNTPKRVRNAPASRHLHCCSHCLPVVHLFCSVFNNLYTRLVCRRGATTSNCVRSSFTSLLVHNSLLYTVRFASIRFDSRLFSQRITCWSPCTCTTQTSSQRALPTPFVSVCRTRSERRASR